MNCPFCGDPDNRVVDSRDVRSGLEVRRRRECSDCGKRFTTYERVDELPTTVVKSRPMSGLTSSRQPSSNVTEGGRASTAKNSSPVFCVRARSGRFPGAIS